MKARIIKQFMIAVVSLTVLLPIRSMATSATVNIEDFTIKPGETKKIFINVNNPDMEVTMLEFYMRLPNGLSVAIEDEALAVDIAGRTTSKKHSLEANFTDGAVHFFLYSGSNAVLTGTSGAVISVKLTAASSFTGGNITFERQLLAAPNEAESKPVNYTYKVIALFDDVTLAAKNYTRRYGDSNPIFDYEVTSGTITSGVPTLNCMATETSPVGTYDVVISKGSVTNGTVNLVKGTLTVTKAPLTISAGNYTKIEGETNPTFIPIFIGFKNGETESVLAKQPTLNCSAMTNSPAGSYPVTVGGAEAQNYEISYQNGMLTVMEKPIISTSSISIEDFTIKPRETKTMFVDVNNPDMEVTMLEFYMRLPEGLSVAIEDNALAVDIAGRTTWRKHSLEVNFTDGTVHFFFYSGSNAVLTGTSGTVISVKLTAASSFTGGNIIFERQLITSPDETECKPDNYIYKVETAVDAEEIITFADANVKSICVTNWDTNGDGELSKMEAAAVTELGTVFKNENIETFDELQYFVGLTSIGDRAFYCRTSLTSITIPNSVTSIFGSAFYGCSGLTSITIPASVTNIGIGAFSGCPNLASIIVDSENTTYDSRDNCNAIIRKASNTLIQGCQTTTIPNDVTSIGWLAFSGFSGLTSITIPNSVTSIGDLAFSGCPGLTSVVVNISSPLAISAETFDNRANATLYVPKNSKAAYAAADV